jgi:hypothetical protein
MKKILLSLFILTGLQQETKAQKEWRVASPDRTLQLVLTNNAGGLSYTILSGGTTVIRPSALGIERSDASFSKGLSFVKTSSRKLNETYTMLTGKRKKNKAMGNETSVFLRNASGVPLRIDLRAYNDGVAFRYAFPGSGKKVTVTGETTEFAVPKGKVWVQNYDIPSQWTPGYEGWFENGIAIGTAAKDSGGWAIPALFQTENHWMLLTESNLTGDYYASRLHPDCSNGVYKIAPPMQSDGQGVGAITATSSVPFATPWRTFIIGKDLNTIIESNLVHHLADANKLGDVSWVKPGRASWSWWGDHESSKDYGKLKNFVDLAQEMGWEYSLVDANWNIMEGGTMEQLAEYAKSKDIGLLLWYNSGGPHNTVTEQPRDILNDSMTRRAEFRRISALGVKGIKVDFFQSDKQPVIQLYLDILKDAAKEKLLVNFHGCTLPRGWFRTYPNLVSMEAVRGAENYGWAPEFAQAAPRLNNTYTYTRNVVGGMDYTPVTFTDYECCAHRTTNAHELALSVLFETGLLHFADRAAGYQSMDPRLKAFVRTVPVVWDDTKFVQGMPGAETVLARRSGNTWYIAGANGDSTARSLSLQLFFIKKGNYNTQLFSDGAGPRTISISEGKWNGVEGTKVDLLPNGGFVMVLSPAKQ